MAERAAVTTTTEQAPSAQVDPSGLAAESFRIPPGLLRIQRAAGNRETGRLLSGVLQAKLRIGPAGDSFEREADRMADTVLRMPTPEAGRRMVRQVTGIPIQRVCTECEEELRRQPIEDEEEEEEFAQRKASSADGSGEAPSPVQSQIAMLRGRGQPLSPSLRSFFEPRFNHDFSGVRLHTGSTAAASAHAMKARAFTVGKDIAFNAGEYAPQNHSGRRLLAHELTHVVQQTPLVARRAPLIQRQVQPAAQQETPLPESEQGPLAPVPGVDEEATPGETPVPGQEAVAPGLLVEDGETEAGPGQLTRSTFLAELRTGICNAADTELAGTAYSAVGCPTIELYLRFYEGLSAARIEQDLVNYVPEAAGVTDARQYIPLAAARVARSVASWVQTGEITGVPEGLPTGLPGLSALAGVLFKARPGGPRGNPNPQAVQARLGAGRPLNSTVNARMGPAFGRSFSNVRVHTDSTARRLSSRHNARAFTVGNHVAFGAGEYRPGTIIGDALIAHELAHTVQQRNADAAMAPLKVDSSAGTSLERDADRSALSVVASLWGGAQDSVRGIAKNAIPRLRSGLGLQRCNRQVETCSAGTKNVSVDLVKLHGSTKTPATDLAEANKIYKKCCVQFTKGIDKPVPEERTKELLDGDTDLNSQGGTQCGSVSAEEKAMFDGVTQDFKLSGKLRAFYVGTFSNRNALAFSAPPFCATGNEAPYVNHCVLQNSALKDTLAHEFGHILINESDDAKWHQGIDDPADKKNLMTSPGRSGSDLDASQCKIIHNNV